jgi:RNA-directed DNA polymerase
VQDEHFAVKWEALGLSWTRAKFRRAGVPTMRIVRYADDFVVMVHGTQGDAEALWDEVATVLAPMGLRLSEEKTMEKVRSLTARAKHRTLGDLLISLNRVLRGWCNYFRHGVSAQTFSYLDHFTWWRIFGWIRKRHAGLNRGNLVRRHIPNWEMRDGHVEMFRPQKVPITRYRFRGAQIPSPWSSEATESPAPVA